MNLNFKFQVRAGETCVALMGEITEATDFSVLARHLPSGFAFDLSGISRINSYGVLAWSRFVKQLKTDGKTFAFERCSPPIVAQLNMVANFAGGAPIRSIQSPFFCESCSHEHTVDLELGPDSLSRLSGSHPCPKCGEAMVFDDLPETYLGLYVQPAKAARG